MFAFVLFAAVGEPTNAGPLASLAGMWPLWLPLAVGALAIGLLLPRPKGTSTLLGALAGLAALGLAGNLLVRTFGLTPETVLFYLFSALAIVSATLMITQQNPARAALSFTLVVLSTCGLFLLLAAPFLMAATIVVYAGAIVVTFLFVLMLAQQAGLSNADARSREPELSTITGFLLLAAILYVLQLGHDTRDLDSVQARIDTALTLEEVATLRKHVGDDSAPDAYLFLQVKNLMTTRGWKDLRNRVEEAEWRWPFDPRESLDAHRRPLTALKDLMLEAKDRLGAARPPAGASLSPLAGTPASVPASEIRRNPQTRLPELPAENSAYLGRALFTDYLLPVELGGLLLLVATVGAIAIGQRRGDEPTRERSTISSDGGATPGRSA